MRRLMLLAVLAALLLVPSAGSAHAGLHTFSDEGGAGTIAIDTAAETISLSLGGFSATVSDPGMTSAGSPNETIAIAYSGGGITIDGVFDTGTGRFAAAVTADGQAWTLRRAAVTVPPLPPLPGRCIPMGGFIICII